MGHRQICASESESEAVGASGEVADGERGEAEAASGHARGSGETQMARVDVMNGSREYKGAITLTPMGWSMC